jgi:hypothetical protein
MEAKVLSKGYTLCMEGKRMFSTYILHKTFCDEEGEGNGLL